MVQPENIDSGHSNFQLDTRSGGHYCNLDYLLVYLALGRQNHERGRRLRWLADSCSAANDVHRLQRFTRYWSLGARASRRIRTYPRHAPWEAMTLGNPHARQQLAMSLRRHFVTFRARPDSLCV